MSINDGGPAFPSSHPVFPEDGMTLRDWFAGQALAGLAANHDFATFDRAEWAYRYADAMLAAREVKP